MVKCPECGAAVSYQGLSKIECSGQGCVNGPPEKPLIDPAVWAEFSKYYLGTQEDFIRTYGDFLK